MSAEEKLKKLQEIVDRQAEDFGLWFVPEYITEDCLQKALRELHAVIEDKTPTECAIEALERMTNEC